MKLGLNKLAAREVVALLILANTPKSLYKAILKSSAYTWLVKNCGEKQLSNYYDELTARARRTPLSAALAYACLVALLNTATSPGAVDASRLEWGENMRSYSNEGELATSRLIIPATGRPAVSFVSSAGNGLSANATRIKENAKTFKLL